MPTTHQPTLPNQLAAQKKNTRSMLVALGMGDYQATAAIPTMYLGVSTTDPASPPVHLILQGIQAKAQIPQTGQFDAATVRTLELVAGPDWQRMMWLEVVGAILDAHAVIPAYMPEELGRRGRGIPQSLHFEENLATPPGVGDIPGPSALGLPLPDVPGGLATYALGAYLLYRHFKKRKA